MFFRRHFEYEGIGLRFQALGVLLVNITEEKLNFVHGLGPIL